MSWFSQEDPSQSANQYLGQIPGAMDPYYQPYINQGRDANKQLQGQYGQLMNDPGSLYSNLGKNYQQSPGFQFKLKQALGAGNSASAAGGMLGTPANQQQQMGTANDLASQDFNDYMQQILGLYGTGLQGEQGLQQQGFQASTGYGDALANLLGTQGQYAYAGAAGRNANKSNMLNNFTQLGGAALGGLAGGPAGAAFGSYLFGNKGGR